MEEKLNVKRLLITIGLVVLTAGATGGVVWYLMDKQAKEDAKAYEDQINELKVPTTDTTTTETADWKTYTNAKYGFNFKYPSDKYTIAADEKDFLGITIKRIDGSTEELSLTVNGPGSDIGLMDEKITTYDATITSGRVALTKKGTVISKEINNDFASIVAQFENGNNSFYLMSRFSITSTKATETETAFTDIFNTITFK